MRKTGFILSTALFLIFTSCDKDDKKPEPVIGEQISKLEYSTNEYTSFQYNSEKLLNKITFAEDGELNHVNISYDEQKKIKDVQGGDGYTYHFNYANGKVSTIDILIGIEKVGYNEYEYDPAGNIKTATTLMKVDNATDFSPFIKIAYEYTADNKGNVSKQTFSMFDDGANNFILTKTIEYSNYDDKVNPLKDFGNLSFLLFSVNTNNNPGKVVEKDEVGIITSTSTFAYTYNSKGRPSQAVETIDDGGPVETHIVKFAY